MASEETEPEVPAEGDAEASGPKSKMPLIAAIVVGLAVGAGSGAVVIGPMVARKLIHTAPAVADSSKGENGAAGKGGEHGAAGEKGAEGQTAKPPVLLLENLVLNPAGSGGQRYLLMSVAIECVDAKSVDGLTARDAELRDVILTTLGKKTVEELSDVSHRDAIKTEILNAVAARFGKTTVKQLYFPQFVIQ